MNFADRSIMARALLLFGVLLLTISACDAINARERYSMNFDWKFHEGGQDIAHTTCSAANFSKSGNYLCEEFIFNDAVPLHDPDGCANVCCAHPTCAFFQISPSGQCSIGNVISIYNGYSWQSTCKKTNGASFYSREYHSNFPDSDPTHFAPTAKDYDDSDWTTINLPHDFIVNATSTPNLSEIEPRPDSHGYLPKNGTLYIMLKYEWFLREFLLTLNGS